jgi:GrpB-like predicted nucleotidyltransferase (UPF0157 family)
LLSWWRKDTVIPVGLLTVVDYDPRWPLVFEGLRAGLASALSEVALSIEHVGSTAVPGLAAKPVIDLDVVVRENHVTDGVRRLQTLGYEHVGDRGIPQREAFQPPPGSTPHHLYLCPITSRALANHLAVRDHLRAHPVDTRTYGELKKRLAIQFANDIDGYVEAKTEFLVGILRRQGIANDALAEIERINHFRR